MSEIFKPLIWFHSKTFISNSVFFCSFLKVYNVTDRLPMRVVLHAGFFYFFMNVFDEFIQINIEVLCWYNS